MAPKSPSLHQRKLRALDDLRYAQMLVRMDCNSLARSKALVRRHAATLRALQHEEKEKKAHLAHH